MNGNSSLMDGTFFADQSFNVKESLKSKEEFTKNSSNPEKIITELISEISKTCNNKLDLNSSNSKNNDNITYNEHIISNANWSPNYNDMESSNQMTQKFKMLQIKDKASNTPQKKKIIKFVPNTNYFDYNLDVDEFSTPINEVNVESFHKNQLVGKISSIKYKTNNIDAINKNNNEQHSNYTSNRSRNQINCFTEPEEYTRSVPYYSQSFHIMPQGTPPQKHVSRFDRGHFPLYGTSLGMKDFNNYAPHLLDPNTNMSGHKQINQVHPSNYTPNFPRIGNTGSFISRSTHYSSNKPNFCVPIEDEINFDNVDEYNTNEDVFKPNPIHENHKTFMHMSERKIRLPTTESLESSNSNQNQWSHITGMNLNHQFNSNDNSNSNPYNYEEKPFSLSFNESNFLSAFTYNNNLSMSINGNPRHKTETFKPVAKVENENYNSADSNTLNLNDIVLGNDKRTTIYIQNIPNKYTDDILLQELDEFTGKFDCLYLPFDFVNNANRGYAFINFTHPYHILNFYERFEGYAWKHFESNKRCQLKYAKFQGIVEIKKHASNYKGKKKPVFFVSDIGSLDIPVKYISKLKVKFPRLKYIEGKKGMITILSF